MGSSQSTTTQYLKKLFSPKFCRILPLHNQQNLFCSWNALVCILRNKAQDFAALSALDLVAATLRKWVTE